MKKEWSNKDSGKYNPPPRRSTEIELEKEIAQVQKSPIVNELMRAVSGLLAVLDSRRHILAVNDTLLKTLGINDISQLIGLRPGEALQCIHSHDEPGGCGTSKFCPSCGAAISIAASLASEEPVEKVCVASTMREGKLKDLYLSVRASTITLNEEKFVLLFIQDLTREQNMEVLDRAFFHDMNNILSALRGACQIYDRKDEEGRIQLIQRVKSTSERLMREMEIQQLLSKDKELTQQRNKVEISRLLLELEKIMETHQASKGKKIVFPLKHPVPDWVLSTDELLLFRILINMLVNALEASPLGAEVKLKLSKHNGCIQFSVWNQVEIPEDVALRIFQRNFSTKEGRGRGLGTFIMKLFAEKYLGGKVYFTSNKSEGTTFYLEVPE